MSFADDDARADRTWANEDRHRNGARQVFGVSAEHFDCIRATEHKLQADEQEDDTAENLERSELGLQNVGEHRVAEDSETPEDRSRNQCGAQ